MWANRATIAPRTILRSAGLLVDRGAWLDADRLLGCAYPRRDGALAACAEPFAGPLAAVSRQTHPPRKGARTMGITDKITGRAKQAAGDLTGDADTRRQGQREEAKGDAKDELARKQEETEAKAGEVADLERKT